MRCLAQGLAHGSLDYLCHLLSECPGELASQVSPSSDPGGSCGRALLGGVQGVVFL